MRSTEPGVLPQSDVFFSTPTATAKRLYFYPVSAGHFFCENGYHLVREDYDSLLVTHILSGTFTFVKDGRPISAHAGETVLLDCYRPHEYYTETRFESVWAHVGGANSYELFREIESTQGNLLRCRDAQRVEKLLFRLHDVLRGGAPASEADMSLDIYKLFYELLHPVGTSGGRREAHEDELHALRQYIFEHLDEPLSVDALARRVHMSASHFSKVFKRETGFSPYEYVLTARLNKAKDLLQNTDFSVFDIALETGFNSESNFICFFTDHVGVSPGRFRKLQF